MKIHSNIKSDLRVKPACGEKSARLKPSRFKPALPQDRVILSGKKAGKAGASEASSRSRKKNWTVLCYFAGDCNLEEQMAKDIVMLETAGSSPEMNILAQFDRGENPSLQLGGKPGSVRYYIEHFKLQPGDLDGYSRYNPPVLHRAFTREPSRLHDRITSPELKDLGPTDSADPKALQEFLEYGLKNYPAKNYLICVYGHGAGIGGLVTDEGPENQHDTIALPEFKKAVKSAQEAAGVDKNRVILALESCQMSQAETAYEFKDLAARMLAPQSSSVWDFPTPLVQEGAGGYNLEEMSRRLFAEGKIHPDLATLSLLNLQKAPGLKKPVIDFIRAVKTSPESPQKLKSIFQTESRPDFSPGSPVCHYASDFTNLAGLILKDPEIKDPKLKKAASRLKAALNKIVVDSFVNPKMEISRDPRGLGVMTAADPQVLGDYQYCELAFPRDTGWGEFITAWGSGLNLKELGDNRLSCPRLKELAKTARRELRDLPSHQRELAKLTKAMQRINAQPGLDQEQKWDQSAYTAYRAPSFQALARVGFSGGLNPEKASQKAPDRALKQLLPFLFNNLSRSAASDPEGLEDILKIKLLVFSELDGEISSKTLSAAARKLLSARGLDKERKLFAGSDLLLTLGNAVHNQKVIELKNRSWTDTSVKDAETFLKGLAGLGKGVKL